MSNVSDSIIEELQNELELRDASIKNQAETIDTLQSKVKEQEDIIESLEEQVQELLDNGSEDDENGTTYTICGEDCYIKVDNIAHETFFELLEEKTKKFSINELTKFLEKL